MWYIKTFQPMLTGWLLEHKHSSDFVYQIYINIRKQTTKLCVLAENKNWYYKTFLLYISNYFNNIFKRPNQMRILSMNSKHRKNIE